MPKAKNVNRALFSVFFVLFILQVVVKLGSTLPSAQAFTLPSPPLVAAHKASAVRNTFPSNSIATESSPLQLQLSLHDTGASADASAFLLSSSMSDDEKSLIATGLGYLIGLGSLLLYTPIAFRVYRQKSADGLTLSTWWLKLASYLSSDIFYITKGYGISTYIETVTITVEAAVVLFLVAYYQQRLFSVQFAGLASAFGVVTAFGLLAAPPGVIASGQLGSVVLNSGALVPQFWLKYRNKTKGDYSPVTASLASLGCAIRIWTTFTLNDSDPVLMTTFTAAFLLNSALLAQIVYYGVFVEGLSPVAVFLADIKSSERAKEELSDIEMDTFVDDEKVSV